MTSDGRRSSYTAPKTYGPHLTFAHIKCRRPIGKDVVYGLFNVAIPYEYIVTEGPEPDTSYIHVADFAPILVYQSPRHVKHKLNEAMLEHCNYVRKMLARIKLRPKPSSRGRTIYRLERPNEINRWTVKVEIGGWREIWKRRIGV